MVLSRTGICLITSMCLLLAVHAQTQPPASVGLANNPNFGEGEGAFRVGGAVSAPVAISAPNPQYSEEARKAKIQGTCVLSLIVGRNGIPRNIRVVSGLGYGLDEKAIEAVKTWRFKPSQKNGKPVPVQTNIDVEFHLTEQP
jgi:protein TonB